MCPCIKYVSLFHILFYLAFSYFIWHVAKRKKKGKQHLPSRSPSCGVLMKCYNAAISKILHPCMWQMGNFKEQNIWLAAWGRVGQCRISVAWAMKEREVKHLSKGGRSLNLNMSYGVAEQSESCRGTRLNGAKEGSPSLRIAVLYLCHYIFLLLLLPLLLSCLPLANSYYSECVPCLAMLRMPHLASFCLILTKTPLGRYHFCLHFVKRETK